MRIRRSGRREGAGIFVYICVWLTEFQSLSLGRDAYPYASMWMIGCRRSSMDG